MIYDLNLHDLIVQDMTRHDITWHDNGHGCDCGGYGNDDDGT